MWLMGSRASIAARLDIPDSLCLTTVSYAADASTPDLGSTQKHNAAVGMSDALCRPDQP